MQIEWSGLKYVISESGRIFRLHIKKNSIKACLFGQMTLTSVYICVCTWIINLQTLVNFNNKTSGGNFDATLNTECKI